MIFRTSLLISILAAASVLSVAQNNAASSSSGPSYRLQTLYRAGIAQQYTVTEHTDVVRQHSDSSKVSYSRDITYYMTLKCIASMDGISQVTVNIDSLEYTFNDGTAPVSYDSQKDITPLDFADLNNYMGPLNRPFELTLSPYGEVTKLEGELIQFWRDYLVENSSDLDPVVLMIWMQSLDRANLLQYGDLQKRIIPGLRVGVDSTWIHNMELRVDGVVYSDRITSKFMENSGGIYTIAVNDTMDAPVQEIHVYGVPFKTKLHEGQAIVDHSIDLSNTGTIRKVSSKVKAWFKGTAANQTFTQRVSSNTTWTLTGQFQW